MNKLFLSNLPASPGVYKMLDDNKDIIYVGKAGNLKKRVSSYFMRTNHSIKNQRLIAKIRDIDYQITSNEQDALLLENNLIKEYKPKYNILLRDDKSYPFIHLDEKHPYPKIETKRVLKGHEGLYGPYTSAYATRIAVNQIQKVFKVRTCSDNYFKNRSRP